MKIIRSWPEKVPPNRPHVNDTLPRLVMRGYDYRCLEEVNDDLILLEWDIAVDRDGLETFLWHARQSPGKVMVAPYRLYMMTAKDQNLPKPVWCHRVYENPEMRDRPRHVTEADEGAHLWGMGMLYLPNEVRRNFLAEWPGHCNDGALSGWHNVNVEPAAKIAWDVRPAHLHYQIDRMV